MKLAVIASIAAALLASCVGVPKVDSFTAPDGRRAYQIRCGGELLTMAACHEKAREMCGGNYEELNRSVTQRSINTGGSTENRSLEVTCSA